MKTAPLLTLFLLLSGIDGAQQLPSFFDVSKYGAVSNGKALGSSAIN